MNVSIQDTYNLGWKLASVIQGVAHPNLLRPDQHVAFMGGLGDAGELERFL